MARNLKFFRKQENVGRLSDLLLPWPGGYGKRAWRSSLESRVRPCRYLLGHSAPVERVPIQATCAFYRA